MKDWIGYKKSIENCEDSFTVGRRNNDVVNWTLASLAIEKQKTEDLIAEFNSMEGLSDEQKDALDDYDWIDKIKIVASYYGDEDPDVLESLLIDVEYN